MEGLRKINFQKKLLSSADPKEVAEGMEDEIYRDLIMFANHYGSYQKAVDAVQSQLKLLCLAAPHSKPLIEQVAERAGQRFLTLVNEIRSKQRVIRSGIASGFQFGNIKIVQSSSKPKNGGKHEKT